MNKYDLIAMFKGPKHYAHHTGVLMRDYYKSLKGPKGKRFNRYADCFFENILNWYSPKDVVKIIKVWLYSYQLYFDVDLLVTSDRLHQTIHGLPQSMPRHEIEEFI